MNKEDFPDESLKITKRALEIISSHTNKKWLNSMMYWNTIKLGQPSQFSLSPNLQFRLEDGVWYSSLYGYYNYFYTFKDLLDYISFYYLFDLMKPAYYGNLQIFNPLELEYNPIKVNPKNYNKIYKLIENTELDLSFDGNILLESIVASGINKNYILCKKIIEKDKKATSVKIYDILYEAYYNDDYEFIQKMTKDSRLDLNKYNKDYFEGYMFVDACNDGKTEIVKIILNNMSEIEGINSGFVWACDGAYLDIVTMLLNDSRVDPSVYDNLVLDRLLSESMVFPNEDKVYIAELILNSPKFKPTDNLNTILEDLISEDDEWSIGIRKLLSSKLNI